MLTAYIAERLPVRLLLPVAGVLALAAGAGGPRSIQALGADGALALVLVVQFRAWDDLADRERDRAGHPGRVLVRTASAGPVALGCLALACAAFTWIAIRDGAGVSLAVLAALNGGLAVWYARRGPRTAAGDHVLLAKYPVMVLVIAGGRVGAHPMRALLAAAAVYLAACVYEAWHDRAAPAAGRALAAWEAILLVFALAALTMGGRS
jgi:hypothetical protein